MPPPAVPAYARIDDITAVTTVIPSLFLDSFRFGSLSSLPRLAVSRPNALRPQVLLSCRSEHGHPLGELDGREPILGESLTCE